MDTRDFLVFDSGGSPASWAVTADKPTIYVTPTFDNNLASETTDTVYVTTTANVANYPPTTTQDKAQLTFSLNGNGSVQIPVFIDISDTPLPPTTDIAGFILGPAGYESQPVTLRNTSNDPQPFQIDLPGWITVSPGNSGTIPGKQGSIGLTFTLNSTTPDANGGVISITFPGFPGTTLAVSVMYVSPASSASAKPATGPRPTATTCSSNQVSAIFARPGNFFQVVASLPQDLRVTVVDGCGASLPPGSAATVSLSSGDPAIALTPWPDGTWRGTWQPLPTSQGPVTINFVASTAGSTLSAHASVSGTVSTSNAAPVVQSGGVVDAASQTGFGTVAPGEIITIYGNNLADALTIAPGHQPATTVGGVSVQLGSSQLPLFYVSPSQINAVIPFAIPLHQVAQLSVQKDGIPSVPIVITSVTANPGIFAMSGAGTGQGAILGPSGNVADSSNPVKVGNIVSIYCSGLGAVNPSVDVSAPAPSTAPLAQATGQVSVFIGNVAAEVTYAGLAPGFSGLYQINARVPAAAPSGPFIPVQIGVNYVASNQVLMAIE